MPSLRAALTGALVGLTCLTTPGLAGGAPKNNTYDYVVVGSGPGGGTIASTLAKKGYSVFLMEAGDDQSANLLTQIPALAPIEQIDNSLHWDFFVRHYKDLDRTLRHNYIVWRLTDGQYWVGRNPPAGAKLLGVYYPRGATLGGSAVINYLVTFYPPASDWQIIATQTGDQAWTPSNMRKIFQRVENNHMVPPGTPGHGFDGFIDVINNVGDASAYKSLPAVVTVLKSMIKQLGLNPDNFYKYLYNDINSADPARDTTPGFFGIASTANTSWHRVTARELVLATLAAKNRDGSPKYPLSLSLNTLATKILFDQSKPHGQAGKPKAIGVEYLQGKSVYRGDPRNTASTPAGVPGVAYARKEVIVAGGTFNSPQLLKLSGIGPAAELAKFHIPLVADLPGVGANLMDNPEIPLVALASSPFISSDNASLACTFGAPGDPCVVQWQQGKGPYTTGGTNSNALVRRTPAAVNAERDMFMFSGNFAFRGFIPITNQTFVDPPTTFGMSTVKMHNQNRAGSVALRSADPRDTPEINFNLFTDGGEVDLGAMLDTIKFGRRALRDVPAPVGPFNFTEPPCRGQPRADGGCDDAVDREWVLDQAFGHHPTGTCAMGGDGDGRAVLDGRLRVRGVRGLRVVDASAFPRTPGAFPVIPTYMLSVQAADFVLADAAGWS